jgi:putative redox protein
MAEDPIASPPIDIVWDGDIRYRGGQAGGPTILIDADRAAAPGPVDTLVVALVACAGVDIVEILRKRRTPAQALRARVHVERAPQAPRRITALRFVYTVATHAPREQVARAVQLAVERYCSVGASLASDIAVSWDIEIEEPSP